MAHRHHCHNHPPPLEQCLCCIPCATPWKLRSSASRHDCHLSRRPAPQCRNTSMQLPTDVLPLPVTTNQPPRALLTPPHSVHMSLVAWHCTAAAPLPQSRKFGAGRPDPCHLHQGPPPRTFGVCGCRIRPREARIWPRWCHRRALLGAPPVDVCARQERREVKAAHRCRHHKLCGLPVGGGIERKGWRLRGWDETGGGGGGS